MEQDFDKLKAEMEAKVKDSFELAPFFEHNLKNFAYRYFDSPSDPETDGKTYSISGLETKLKNALKSSENTIVAGVTELAKTVPYKDNPAVQYSLNIEILTFDSTRGGEVKIYSKVNWDFPEFKENSKSYSKEESLKFEDIIILRNKLAKHMESVCELFPQV